jgi:hypothetical protein
MLYVYNDACLLGDSLCSLPTFQALALRSEEPVYWYLDNKFTRELMPKSYNLIFTPEPPVGMTKRIDLSVLRSFNNYSVFMHMIHAYMRDVGLPISKELPKLDIEYEKIDVPVYDYVISPFSASDVKNNKMWPLDRWQKVIHKLKEGGATIAVVGSSRTDKEVLTDVDYYFDYKLDYICNLLLAAKKVLTIDNGISHLCHFVGANHRMLYPACLPSHWVDNRNPNAKRIIAHPLQFNVNSMIQLAKL